MTGDETWLHFFFEPDNKLNNKMWVGENNERPVVAHQSRSVERVMYALFFDSNGIVAHLSVPENCSITGTFYCDFVLSAIVNHYHAKVLEGQGPKDQITPMIMHPIILQC